MEAVIEFLDNLDNITPVQMTDCFNTNVQDLYKTNQYKSCDFNDELNYCIDINETEFKPSEFKPAEVNSHEDISIYLV